MEAFGKTHVGLIRENNQDSFLTIQNDKEMLIIVCDGIGGGRAGDIASKLACEIMKDCFLKKPYYLQDEENKQWIRDSIALANDTILQEGYTSLKKRGMGTTLVGVLINPQSTICFHLGDSRLYAYYDEFVCMTQDHNLAYDLLKSGEMSEEEVANHPKGNALTNALGIWSRYSIDIQTIRRDYQYLLVCSDGLHSMVLEDEIEKILIDTCKVEDKVECLIQKAMEHGGSDNITAVVVENLEENKHE